MKSDDNDVNSPQPDLENSETPENKATPSAKRLNTNKTESSMSINLSESLRRTREPWSILEQPRPQHQPTDEEMRDFIITKIFYRLLDDLDCQDGVQNVHPFVERIQMDHGLILTHVNRVSGCLHVLCPEQQACEYLYNLAGNNELSSIVNECFLSTDILGDLKMLKVELSAVITESVYKRCMNELYVPTRIAYK